MKWNGQVSCTNNFDQLLQLQRQHLSFNQHSTTYTPVQLQDCNQKNKDLPSNNFDLNSIWFNDDDEELVSEDLDMKSICLSQGEEVLTSSQHLDLNSICLSQDEEDLKSSEDLDCDDLDLSSIYSSQDEGDLTSSEDLDLSSICFSEESFSLARWAMLPSDGCSAVLKNCLDSGEALMKSAELSDLLI
ncbi:unnamed protein product [Aphanomyces euteiches]